MKSSGHVSSILPEYGAWRGLSLAGGDGAFLSHSAYLDTVIAVRDDVRWKLSVGGLTMAVGRPPSFRFFTCPNCRALYDVVRGEAGSETVDQEVACRVCGAPFPGRENGFVKDRCPALLQRPTAFSIKPASVQ
jgi:hypothetical protein